MFKEKAIFIIEKTKFWLNKKGTKRVLSNFTWLTIFQAVEKIIPLITIPYLLRVIGVEKWGLITFALSFIQYFNTFVDYGFNVTAVREVSLNQENKDKLDNIFSNVMFVKLIFLLISFLIFYLIIFLNNKFWQYKLVFIFTFGWVIGQTIFPLWFFQGMEKMKFSTILSSLAKLIFLVLIFLFVKREQDYYLVPLFNSSGMIISGTIGILIAKVKFKINFKMPNLLTLINTMKEGGKVFISNLFISFYTNSRIFALGLFTDNTIVGYYGIAEKIAFYLGMPFGLFAQAMYPRISNLYGNSKEKFFKLVKYLNIGSFLWGTLIFIVGILFSGIIVYFLTGKSINFQTKFSLIFLLLGTFFVHSNTFRIQYFLATARFGIYTIIHIISGVIGLALIFILSYFFSYRGTAISVALIEGMIFILSVILYNIIRKT